MLASVHRILLILFISNGLAFGYLYVRESESREVKDLNGIWAFRADFSSNRNAGFEGKWYARPLAKSGVTIPMAVPSSFNDITMDAKLRDFVGWVWYQRDFFVPTSWTADKHRVVLRFESVFYRCIVWVNGKRAMEHVGGHLPFEDEVNTLLKHGQSNMITVAVNNTLTPTTLPCGTICQVDENDQHLYPPHYFTQNLQFDFFNYAGLHRPVRLYTTPRTYLKDVTITTEIRPNFALVNFRTLVGNLKSVDVRSVYVKYVLFDRENVEVGSVNGNQLLNGKLKVSKAKLWWPIDMSERPGYMYTLMITLRVGEVTDVYRIPVGIRTVKVDGLLFLINGKQFYFKGFGMHEDYNIRGRGEDFPSILKDFNLIKWLGGNSFRTSHYPYSEEIMNLADQQGIVVIDEAPAVGLYKINFNNETLDLHRRIMAELIQRDKNHPSVVMWSVANEPRSDLEESEKYFREIFGETRRLDPARPVTFVTHMRPENDKVIHLVDVLCCNRYYSWYHDFGHLEIIQSKLEIELQKWFMASKKPIIQTEYGAGAIAGLHMEPPVMFSEEYQVASIREYFKIFDKLRHEFLVGEMIWSFADFMTSQGTTRVVGNRKGLFTRDRQPKAAAHAIRERYHHLNNHYHQPTTPVKKYTPNPSPLRNI